MEQAVIFGQAAGGAVDAAEVGRGRQVGLTPPFLSGPDLREAGPGQIPQGPGLGGDVQAAAEPDQAVGPDDRG